MVLLFRQFYLYADLSHRTRKSKGHDSPYPALSLQIPGIFQTQLLNEQELFAFPDREGLYYLLENAVPL
jgi:hypothetical protein